MTLDSAAIIALELVDFPQSHCLISDWLGVGLSDNLRNETLRDRRETEERRVELMETKPGGGCEVGPGSRLVH